jgi:hypothetical protein
MTTTTIGGELERVRLAYRLERIDRVLVELRRCAEQALRADGVVPQSLRASIVDFTRERDRTRDALEGGHFVRSQP